MKRAAVTLLSLLSVVSTAHLHAQNTKTNVVEPLKVATVIPSEGPMTEMALATKDVLTAYFAELNSAGGLNGRKIEFVVGNVGPGASGLRTLMNERVFAIVGGVVAGSDVEAMTVAKELRVPWIGPATLLTENDSLANPFIYYLLPGVREQGRVMVEFLAGKPELRRKPAHIVQFEGQLPAATAAGVEFEAAKLGWRMSKTVVKSDFNAREIAVRLKGAGVETVFFLGGGGRDLDFLGAAAEIGWTPNVSVLGVLGSPNIGKAAPADFPARLTVIFPTVPSDVTKAGIETLRSLSQKHGFKLRNISSQISALAAAKLFVEAVQRAGHEPTRARFISSLEQIRDFETGLTPRLAFGPNRRVGSLGAYVVRINDQTREYAADPTWISLN
jgi:ABC-type branched-subunit amino acid transport system substrate-binding protein